MSEEDYILVLPSTFKNRDVHNKLARIYIDDTHIVKHDEAIIMEAFKYDFNKLLGPKFEIRQHRFEPYMSKYTLGLIMY